MGLSAEQLGAFEDAAYEAAVVPDNWPKVLEQVSALSGTAGTGLVAINERGVHITASPTLQAAGRKIVAEGYMARSGRAAGVIAKGLVGVPRFLNEFDFYSDLSEAETDPIVQEIFRPIGMGWAAGFLVKLPHDDLLVVNVEQRFELGPIQGDALARLDSLYSPLARAAMVGARADFAKVRSAVETLGELGLPAAGVTRSGRVHIANSLFAGRVDVWTTRGRDIIALLDHTADSLLRDALQAVDDVRAPRSIPVRGEPDGPITGVIQVLPIRRTANDVFGGTTAILVMTTGAVPDATLIHALFDLTPAELMVAARVAEGMSPKQVAALTGKSVNTIRNQLSSAMTKTGTHRQVDLALLFRQLGKTQ
jgi:DNA-binding CsgD family transcriptional regulator